MSTTTARPRQTTMAGVMVMLGGIFVVLSVWDTVSRLRSMETRESIEKFLADAPGRDLGLSVESTIQAMHAIAIVAALCAVAAVALGWQALQRSRGARVALSAVAVPLFLTGLVAGGFMAALVAAATAVLWLSPSREWFAGQPIPEQGKSKRSQEGMQVWEQTPNRGSEPAASQSPSGWSVSGGSPDRRPDPVTVALVLTIVAASGVFIMTLISLMLLVSQPEVVLEELRRQNPDLEDRGVTESLLRTTSYVSGALVMLWSAAAIVLAVLTAGRRAWAARGLMICAATCAVFSLVATLASPAALIPAIAALVTVSCLRRPDVRAWFEDRPGPSAE